MTADRPLLPREHGAYGQLLLPLCCGLAAGRPGPAALLLAAGALCAFVSHEPLLVLAGLRGARTRAEVGDRALRLLWPLAASALLLGSLGLWLSPAAARWLSLLPLALAAALVPALLTGREQTLGGQLLASAALSAAAAPIAAAAGVPPGSVLGAWAAWALGFGATTAGVRRVLDTRRKEARPQLALLVGCTLLAAAPLLPLSLAVSGSPVARELALAACAGPLVLVGWALWLRPPHPRALKKVGWAAVAASVATGAALLATSRKG
jgi:hypothetical protein